MHARKITALILASALMLTVSACKKNSSDKDEQTEGISPSGVYDEPSSTEGSGTLPTTMSLPVSDRTDESYGGNTGSETSGSTEAATAAQSSENGNEGGIQGSEPDQTEPEAEEDAALIPEGVELSVFADAASRNFDSVDEIPLTAYDPIHFWYAMNCLCVDYGEMMGGVIDPGNNEIVYSDEQIAAFAEVMFCDYDEVPEIPEGLAVRRVDGGYAFGCNSGGFTPAELISTEEDDGSVIMTLKIEGGAEDGSDLYRYVRLFEADNQYSLAVSNVRVGQNG